VTELAPDIQDKGRHSTGPSNHKSLKACYCSALRHRCPRRRQDGIREAIAYAPGGIANFWAADSVNCSMNIALHRCPLLLMAATICATPVSARSYLNCVAKKVIIVDSPRGSNLSSTEDNLGFWIDEAAKTIMLADGTLLTVHRFDDHWISADHGDMAYEFDRQNGNLMYASSTTKEGVGTTTIGSGRCEIAAGPAG